MGERCELFSEVEGPTCAPLAEVRMATAVREFDNNTLKRCAISLFLFLEWCGNVKPLFSRQVMMVYISNDLVPPSPFSKEVMMEYIQSICMNGARQEDISDFLRAIRVGEQILRFHVSGLQRGSAALHLPPTARALDILHARMIEFAALHDPDVKMRVVAGYLCFEIYCSSAIASQLEEEPELGLWKKVLFLCFQNGQHCRIVGPARGLVTSGVWAQSWLDARVRMGLRAHSDISASGTHEVLMPHMNDNGVVRDQAMTATEAAEKMRSLLVAYGASPEEVTSYTLQSCHSAMYTWSRAHGQDLCSPPPAIEVAEHTTMGNNIETPDSVIRPMVDSLSETASFLCMLRTGSRTKDETN